MNAISEATDHTRVCSRLTGTPRSAARSALSALALIAMPTLLIRRNIARPSRVKRRHDHGDHVVRVEDDRADRELHVERRREALSEEREVLAPSPGQQDRQPTEELGEPERRDRDHQAGRVEEPPDDEQLDDGAERERGDDADGHGEQVRPRPRRHEHDDQHDRQRAEVALREVDEAVRPVGQRHARAR